MQPSSLLHIHQLSVNLLDEAPTVLPSVYVGYREFPFTFGTRPLLLLHKMREQALMRRDLTEHDVADTDLVLKLDGRVCATVVAGHPWIQRPPRAAVTHTPATEELVLDHQVALFPARDLRVPIGAQRPVQIELRRTTIV